MKWRVGFGQCAMSELHKDMEHVKDCPYSTEAVWGSWKSNVHTFYRALACPLLLVSQEWTHYHSHESRLCGYCNAACTRTPVTSLYTLHSPHFDLAAMHVGWTDACSGLWDTHYLLVLSTAFQRDSGACDIGFSFVWLRQPRTTVAC